MEAIQRPEYPDRAQAPAVRHLGWILFGAFLLVVAVIGALVMQWKVELGQQREAAGWRTVSTGLLLWLFISAGSLAAILFLKMAA